MIKIPLENIIPLSDARTNFSKIIDETIGENAYLITKGGKPAVVIASAEAVEHLVGSDKILAVEEEKESSNKITETLDLEAEELQKLKEIPENTKEPAIEETVKEDIKSINKDDGSIKSLSTEELFNIGVEKNNETGPEKSIEDELKDLKPATEEKPAPTEKTPEEPSNAVSTESMPVSENIEITSKDIQGETPANNTEASSNSEPEDQTSKLDGIDLDALRRKKEEEEDPPRPEETPIIRQDSYFYSEGSNKGKNKEDDFGL